MSGLRKELRGDVLWLTFDRPDRLNALDAPTASALAAAFGGLAADESIRVVVLRGAGRAFCSGLDLRSEDTGSVGAHLAQTILAMRGCPQPVIALMHGAACGGGFALALAADLRIAGRSARMNDTFITLGLSGCELGLSYFLPRLVGHARAAEIMYTGAFVDASTAERIGLVSSVVDDEALEEAGTTLAEQLLRATPLGLRLTKQTLAAAASLDDLGQVIALEAQAQNECLAGPDFAEALARFRSR